MLTMYDLDTIPGERMRNAETAAATVFAHSRLGVGDRGDARSYSQALTEVHR